MNGRARILVALLVGAAALLPALPGSLAAEGTAASAASDEAPRSPARSTRPALSESPEPLLEVFREWVARAQDELRIEGSPAPARTLIAATDYGGYRASASFGALLSESWQRSRPGRVEVVVGDDAMDSGRFRQGRSEGVWQRPDFVVENADIAIARDLWVSTDSSYKDAIALLQAKAAARVTVGGEPPPDWSQAEPVNVQIIDEVDQIDAEHLRRLVIEGSEVLREVPGLQTGEMRVNTIDGHYILATSEGTELIQPRGYAALYARATLRANDGTVISAHRQWLAVEASDLPDVMEVRREVEGMGRSLLARADAADVAWYEGPVVFEEEAAADFLRYLLGPELSGTPPAPVGSQSYERQVRGGPRLGRRLLPAGWSVVDDPSTDTGRLGHYLFDRQGVAGERVEVVEDGWVRDLLMTRVPRKEIQASNGHARGSTQGAWTARPSQLTVRPARDLSLRRFDRLVGRARQAAGQERMLVIRRLGLGREGFLPKVEEAVWRSADGLEVPVRGLVFQKVDRRTLRDIALAGGGEQEREYLASWEAGGWHGSDRGMPSMLRSPRRLLVDDMELVAPGPDTEAHRMPAPGLGLGLEPAPPAGAWPPPPLDSAEGSLPSPGHAPQGSAPLSAQSPSGPAGLGAASQ